MRFEGTGKKVEQMNRCGACGYEFAVLVKTGKPDVTETDGGMRVSVRATLDKPAFCPKCGERL